MHPTPIRALVRTSNRRRIPPWFDRGGPGESRRDLDASMTRTLLASASLVLLAACARSNPAPAPAAAPAPAPVQAAGSFFIGVDTSRLPEPTRAAVIAAQKDIDLVLQGKEPACKNAPDSADSDGGTAQYACQGYDLTVMQSLYRLGDVPGYLYGPIVTFQGDYSISLVRFYSNEELQALLQHPQ